MLKTGRNYGLDLLRSLAITLVFLAHYNILTDQRLFGPFGQMGGVGVDLFFSLSGYLIANQIFHSLRRGTFTLRTFYLRRVFRILPNFLVVLSLYFAIPIFREKPLTIPFWKFITFTQNFFLIPSAFSHAWSLCIEEHFYLLLPLISLFIAKKQKARIGWIIILAILVAEITLRSIIWIVYLRHAPDGVGMISMSMIYAPTFTRLDSLVLGVFLALVKHHHLRIWSNLTKKGNLALLLGIVGYGIVVYIYQNFTAARFVSASLSYTLLAFSSMLLTLSALSPTSLLHRVRIPGAMTLATLSYAIYLTHKSFIHLSQLILSNWSLNKSNLVMLTLSIVISVLGAGLLYTCIEKPFLKIRDKIERMRFSGETLRPTETTVQIL